MEYQITLRPAVTDAHFEGILQLQRQNLYSLISPEQQANEGFVFARHNLKLLKAMATHLPQVVALYNNEVVGYNLAMSMAMQDKVPSLVTMFAQFKICRYSGKSLSDYQFFIGGQVCVDKDFRGQHLLSKLYNTTRNLVSPDHQLCVTEIAARNHRSLKAHVKMGFEVISTYQDEKELWHIVVWDMQR